jgi:hypothetical protein
MCACGFVSPLPSASAGQQHRQQHFTACARITSDFNRWVWRVGLCARGSEVFSARRTRTVKLRWRTRVALSAIMACAQSARHLKTVQSFDHAYFEGLHFFAGAGWCTEGPCVCVCASVLPTTNSYHVVVKSSEFESDHIDSAQFVARAAAELRHSVHVCGPPHSS